MFFEAKPVFRFRFVFLGFPAHTFNQIIPLIIDFKDMMVVKVLDPINESFYSWSRLMHFEGLKKSYKLERLCIIRIC